MKATNILQHETKTAILAEEETVEAFNIGVNALEVAGQTVMHCHIHYPEEERRYRKPAR
jgi:diadenosine tetraphosphate (Ap4A) HIT family hydrolase